MQEYVKPMFPADLLRPFDNAEWLFELNQGGTRAISVLKNDSVSIYAQKNHLLNSEYSSVVNDLKRLNVRAVFDGEIVSAASGRPTGNEDSVPARYFIFDILSFNGESLLKTPLFRRKMLLRNIVGGDFNNICLQYFVAGSGCDLYKTAKKENLEGITAKKYDGFYYPGKISSDWLKIRVTNTREVYICGFTKAVEKRGQPGSIIAGYESNGRFFYSGYITAKPNSAYMQELFMRLIPLITEESPFGNDIQPKKDIIWVRPVIKCEVKYLGLTRNHLMRQPVLLSVT